MDRAIGKPVKSDIEGVVGHEEAVFGLADHGIFKESAGRPI
jgi:hypothetical protein